MNDLRKTWHAPRILAPGLLLATLALPAGAVDFTTKDGD